MRRLPTKEEIRKRAEGLDITAAITHGLPGITPERHELQESGRLKEAQRDLMTSEEKKYRAQAEQYARTMAAEVGLYVLSPGEYREYKKKMKFTLKPGHIWTGKKWVKFRGTVDMRRVPGTEKVKVSIISPKGVRKHVKTVRIPRKKQPKRKSLLRTIRKISMRKGMAHIEKDLGLKMDIRGEILDPKTKKTISTLVREGILFKPHPSFLKPTAMPIKAPKKPRIVSPADIVLGKKARAPRKKRKRIHTERSGKTMKALRKVNGVNVFSFPDHVWKVKPARRRKR